MERRSKSKPSMTAGKVRKHRSLRLLVVDTGAEVANLLPRCASAANLDVILTNSLAQARAALAKSSVDLALVNLNLPDGDGLELVEELANSRRLTQTIAIANTTPTEKLVQAVRSGASDLLDKSVDVEELNLRISAAISRYEKDSKKRSRVQRLRRICKKLNIAREEVSQQVDILCNDLVSAYQELANQMQQVVQSSEFSGVIRQELDLEQLLRKTLEFIIQKAGPTNAAIFLPSTADEYSLGGYVNYDCTNEASDILLDHLADMVAPKLAQSGSVLHLTDSESLQEWIGNDAVYLTGCHMVGFACQHEQEALAIVLLFRDGSVPFDEHVLETAVAIAPMLGEYLARIIRVHHRHIPDETLFEGDGDLPF